MVNKCYWYEIVYRPCAIDMRGEDLESAELVKIAYMSNERVSDILIVTHVVDTSAFVVFLSS